MNFYFQFIQTLCEMNACNFYFFNQHSSSDLSLGALDTGDFP